MRGSHGEKESGREREWERERAGGREGIGREGEREMSKKRKTNKLDMLMETEMRGGID